MSAQSLFTGRLRCTSMSTVRWAHRGEKHALWRNHGLRSLEGKQASCMASERWRSVAREFAACEMAHLVSCLEGNGLSAHT